MLHLRRDEAEHVLSSPQQPRTSGIVDGRLRLVEMLEGILLVATIGVIEEGLDEAVIAEL